ncbi:MAG TPA: catechol 1,2-dioxygenase [Dongiaceae bacterium]|nr:catechol 1,2-dioxygenase [Dongiaceae bacterium]
MPKNLIAKSVIQALAHRAAGLDNKGGNERIKTIAQRLLTDLFTAIDDLDIQMDEIWAGVAFLEQAAAAKQLGLIVPGIALEHFLDLRLDAAERQAGITEGTSRTIEGPLYVAGAPLTRGEARLDDGTDDGEILFMQGRVLDPQGKPVAGAIVDVWHANSFGNYSHFGPKQSPYNLRRRIETDAEGRYRFRSIMPSGYGCPPGSEAETLMKALGRHARRPAHIHFFVSAPGYRHLTTQINIAGDTYLHDDFAFATRDDLIPEVERVSAPAAMKERGLNKPFASIDFDFAIVPEVEGAIGTVVNRARAAA